MRLSKRLLRFIILLFLWMPISYPAYSTDCDEPETVIYSGGGEIFVIRVRDQNSHLPIKGATVILKCVFYNRCCGRPVEEKHLNDTTDKDGKAVLGVLIGERLIGSSYYGDFEVKLEVRAQEFKHFTSSFLWLKDIRGSYPSEKGFSINEEENGFWFAEYNWASRGIRWEDVHVGSIIIDMRSSG